MAGPRIGAGTQIGVNVTILPFVRIGAGALIGAGSVVTRDVPATTVAFGNPARAAPQGRGTARHPGASGHGRASASPYQLADGSAGKGTPP